MALIIGELESNISDIPFDILDDFIETTVSSHEKYGHVKQETVYASRNNRPYPWHRRVLEHNQSVFHNYRDHKFFANLNTVIDSLPIDRRFMVLLYQKQQPEYDFNFHFDDDRPWGFRICLGLDTSKTFLELSKIKTEYQQHALELKKIENYMVEDKLYKIVPKKSNTIFCINSLEYPHRVPVDSNKGRVSIVVGGDLKQLNNFNYIQRIDE